MALVRMEFPSIEKELGLKRTDLAENGGEIDSERLKKLVGEYYNSITPAQRRSFLLTLGLTISPQSPAYFLIGIGHHTDGYNNRYQDIVSFLQ